MKYETAQNSKNILVFNILMTHRTLVKVQILKKQLFSN